MFRSSVRAPFPGQPEHPGDAILVGDGHVTAEVGP